MHRNFQIIPLLFIFSLMISIPVWAQSEWVTMNGPEGGNITTIVFDEVNPDIVFAGTATGGVFYSFDGGQNWTPKNNGLHTFEINSLALVSNGNTQLWCGTNHGLYISENFGESWELAGYDSLVIYDVKIHPDNASLIMLATEKGILKSEDGGKSWIFFNNGLLEKCAYTVYFQATDSATVFAGTPGGVFKSIDLGGDWDEYGLSDYAVQALAMHANSKRTLYAATRENGLFRNQSTGIEWTSLENGIDGKEITALITEPGSSGTIYAATRNHLIYKSTNRGDFWQVLENGLNTASIFAIALNSDNPEKILTGTSNGVFKSEDSGESWDTASSGLVAVKINAIAINSENSFHCLLGTDGNLFVSHDQGETWNSQIQDFGGKMITDIVFSPFDTSLIWIATEEHGLFKSMDSGKSWVQAGEFTQVNKIYPSIHESEQVLAIADDGLYKSYDLGQTWTLKASGMQSAIPGALAFNPQRPLELVVSTRNSGIYKSTNGGERWFRSNSGLGSSDIFTIVRAGTGDDSFLLTGTPEGVYKSDNNGDSWDFSGLAGQKIIQLECESSNPNSVFALTGDGKVWSSSDIGEHWNETGTSNITTKLICLTADPVASGVLFAGSQGSGLYQYRPEMPQIAIFPKNMDFGNVPLDSTTELSLIIRNNGAAPLQILGSTISEAEFRMGDLPDIIESTDADTVQLTFTPTAEKEYQADLQIQSNDPDHPLLTISLSGKGVKPQILLSTNRIEFGEVKVNESKKENLTISNTGSTKIIINEVRNQQPDFTFVLKKNSLEPDEDTSLEITFMPVSAGVVIDTVVIENSAENQIVILEGEGIASELTVAATFHDFSDVELGVPANFLIPVTNSGQVPLKILNLNLKNRPVFQVTSIVSEIPASATRNLEVSFTPVEKKVYEDTLRITTDGGEAVVAFQGRGVLIPLVLNENAHDFGNVPVGGASESWNLSVTNPNKSSIKLASAAVGNPAIFQCTFSDSTIESGKTTNFSLGFRPNRARSFSDKLTLKSTYWDTTVTLTGTGAAPVMVLSHNELDFGETPVGESQFRELTIENQGNDTLKIEAIALNDNAFKAEEKSLNILADAKYVLKITFQPEKTGDVEGELTLQTNMGNYTVQLTGSGIMQPLGLSAVIHDFGSVSVGATSSAWSLSLKNLNLAAVDITQLSVRQETIFRLKNQPKAISANDTALVKIEFTPESRKVYLDTLTIKTTIGDTMVLLSGEGSAAEISLSDSLINFGHVKIGESFQQAVEITNTGTDSLWIYNVTHQSPYFSVPASQKMILPDQSWEIKIKFTPLEQKTYRDTVLINSNVGETKIYVEGAGSTSPLTLSEREYDFGKVRVGREAVPVKIILTNPNPAAAKLTAVYWKHPDVFSALFADSTIASGDSLEVLLGFQPVEAFEYSDSLIFTTATWRGAVVIFGEGVMPQLAISEKEIDFGKVPIGNSGQILLVLKNIGSDTLTISEIQNLNSRFSVKSQTPIRILPDDSCSVPVVFHPIENVMYEDSLIFLSDGGNVTIRMRGYGENGAALVLQDSVADFESVRVGEKQSLKLQLKNYGNSRLVLEKSNLSLDVFSIISFPDELDPAQTEIIEIAFQPTHRQLFQDQFEIYAQADTCTVHLTGKGIAPVIGISVKNLLFENIAPESTATKSLWVRNTGDDSLKITSIEATPDEFQATPTQAIINAGDSLNLQIHFHPVSNDIISGQLAIQSDDLAQSEITIELKGIPGSNDQTAPQISHTPIAQYQIAKPLNLAATISDEESGLTGAQLVYRQGGEDEFLKRLDFQAGSATIPAEDLTLNGIEYYIEAQDSAGNASRLPEFSAFFAAGYNAAGDCYRNEQGEPVPQPYGDSQSSYRLISVPLVLDNPQPSAVIGDELGTYDETKWVFADYQQTENGKITYVYYNQTGKISDFTPGKAFWLLLTQENVVLNSGPGHSVNTTAPWSIPLHPGWNLVGNPFVFDIPESQIRFASNDNPLMAYAYEGQWSTVNHLQPWKGYAIFNFHSSNDTLLVFPNQTLVGEYTTLNRAIPEIDWKINIQAACEKTKDTNNWVGAAQAAAAGWDWLDQPEPPMIGKYVSVYFEHPEWDLPTNKFSTQCDKSTDKGHVFEFTVESNFTDSKVELSFEIPDMLPEKYQVILVDSKVQFAQNLDKITTYEFQTSPEEQTRRFKLIIGDESFIASRQSEIPKLPESFELHQNYPNPMAYFTRIEYALPKPSPVTLTVFNLQGQVVRSIVLNKWHEAGQHARIWDGRNAGGELVANGIYFYRLKTEKNILTQRLILLR